MRTLHEVRQLQAENDRANHVSQVETHAIS